MTLPTTGYGTANVTNPSSALTDFSLLVDLSRMHASWWAAVDTADGTKGRAAIDSSGTELACDWINFNNGTSTGFLRVKWTGSLASSGTQTLRIYPPVAANSSVAASDTYGSNNAYNSNWAAYYTLGVNANDRTSNSRNLTTTGSPGTSAGPVTGGRNYDGSTTYEQWSGTAFGTNFTRTVMAWVKQNATGYAGIAEVRGGTGGGSISEVGIASGTKVCATGDATLGAGNALEVTANGNTFKHYAAVFRANNDFDLYKSGAFEANSTTAQTSGGTPQLISIGSRYGGSQKADVEIDDVQIFDATLSSAWIAEEYSQANSQSTFWGTWGWTASGGIGGMLTTGKLAGHRGPLFGGRLVV